MNLIGNKNDPDRNGEGYLDMTAYEAIKKQEEKERFNKFINSVFKLCERYGYILEGRITVKDKKTGRVWK